VIPTNTSNPNPNQQIVTHPTHYTTQPPFPLTAQEIPTTSAIPSLNLEDKVFFEKEAIDRQPRPIRSRVKPIRFRDYI